MPGPSLGRWPRRLWPKWGPGSQAYLIVRPKGTHREKVTIHDALAAYFYGVFGACVITTVVGVVMFIDVALKESTAPHGDEVSLASVLVGTGRNGSPAAMPEALEGQD